MYSVFQAIQRVNDSEDLAVEDCRYEIVREAMYEESLQHTAEHNFPDEPVCRSLGMILDEEAKELCKGPLLQNMTIVLVSTKTREIIGQRVFSIASKQDEINADDFKVPANRKFVKLCEDINNLCDVWSRYGVDEAFDLFGISVHKEHRHKGIGLKLMQAALLFIKSMNLGRPVLVKGAGDSNYSKRIFERTGFECLGEIVFDDYIVDGEQVLTNMGEHKSIKVYCQMV